MRKAGRENARETTLTVVDGRRMHARVSMGGPGGTPIVLVHGLVVSGRYMVPLMDELARTHDVYAPDLPGFGQSEGAERALGVDGLADALAAWMRAAGLVRAALVGNSIGCQVIASLAGRHPGLVDKVVLQGQTMDRRARSMPRHALRFLLDMARERPSLILVEWLDLLRAGPGRSFRTFRHALDDPVEERLPMVQAPALVVHGSRDRISPQGWAEEVARLLPQGRLVVLPGAPHAANYSAPETFARAVRSFLAEA